MVNIYQVQNEDDLQDFRDLLVEYLSWATQRAKDLYDQDVDMEEMLDHSLSDIKDFSPPTGCLLIAKMGSELAGMACLKGIRENTCEIKRMYVRPEYRGLKIGRSLLEQLIVNAKDLGYSQIFLDSAQFMREAHTLYRSAGFKDIHLYPETEMTDDFEEHMVYMELDL